MSSSGNPDLAERASSGIPSHFAADITDARAFAEPERLHNAFAWLRANQPVVKVANPNFDPFWLVTKHQDILDIEKKADIFHNGDRSTILAPADMLAAIEAVMHSPHLTRAVVNMDGREHRVYRTLTQSWFMPANVKKLSDRIRSIAKINVERMLAHGTECDFVADVALHYPLHVIMEILGVPEADEAKMLVLTQQLFGARDPELSRSSGAMADAATGLAVFQAVLNDFYAYFRAIAQDRRSSPRDDLATVIANAVIDGQPISDHESVSSSHLEAQLYNYLLNFFDLYYQNGDFGYSSRSSSAFRVPYEAAYDGADTMFHFKHRDCYYIKTGNSFPEVALEVASKRLAFRLGAGGNDETGAQNNNKDAAIKLYALTGVAEEEETVVVHFRLAKEGTPKAEIYRQVLAALAPDTEIASYLIKKTKDGPASVFKDLGKDHNKAEGGQIKGINQLRLTEDAYFAELAKIDHFRGLGSNAEARIAALRTDATAQILLTIDRSLNRFYVGQDADYFIHKDLKGFLSREKDRFIKSVIFSDLDALLSQNGDASTRVLARAFNAVAVRIIEFLDATETFQRNLFTLKKKVIDTHWLISLGKIPENYWPGLLANERLRVWWKAELKQVVASIDDMRALPTLRCQAPNLQSRPRVQRAAPDCRSLRWKMELVSSRGGQL